MNFLIFLFILSSTQIWSFPKKDVLISKKVLFGKSSSSHQPNIRIVGGENIAIEKVPYQISLRENGEHFCGGSIVSQTQIITAAHCVLGKQANKLSIRAGSSKISDGGQIVNVSKITTHPQYTSKTIDYDIAVLELSSKLTLGTAVATITLPKSTDSWSAKTEALITGWGLTQENSTKLSDTLQGVTIEIVDQKTCKSAYGQSTITNNMICAGVNGGGKDACQDDSGGPLQINGVLAGVVSFGNGCGKAGFPGVYASTAAFRTFIQNVTRL